MDNNTIHSLTTPLHFGYPPLQYPYTSVREGYGQDHYSQKNLRTIGISMNL
jgi:hypothetical protein